MPQEIIGIAKMSLARMAVSRLIADQKAKILEKELQKNYPYAMPPVSAIENMSYSAIGKRDWVDLDAICKEIEAEYIAQLVSMDACPAKTEEEAKAWVKALEAKK